MSNADTAIRTALVTGASRGLGAEIARRLFGDGISLILAARDDDALKQLAGELRGQPTKERQTVVTHAIDLEDFCQVEQLLDHCMAGPDFVEIVVNNAAVQGPIGSFDAVNFSAWQAVFQTNLFSPARICHGLIGAMRRLGRGKIINLSGGGATSPRPDVSAYGTSKCALVRFSETLAQELKGTGIDVNCVAPGAMNTRMLREILDAGPAGARQEYEKALRQEQSGGAPPARAAELIAFLASPASDGITGRLISAAWDPWLDLPAHRDELSASDIYTLRRIVPEDRGLKW